MKSTLRAAALSLLAFAGPAGVITTFSPAPAHAQPAAAPAKIVVVNIGTIFDKCAETVAFTQRMKLRGAQLQQQAQARQAQAEELRKQLQEIFKPGTAEYEDANRKYVQLVIEDQVQKQVITEEVDRETKKHFRSVMDKLDALIGTIAKEQGAAIVLADSRTALTEEQWAGGKSQDIFGVYSRRSVLFVDPSLDLTSVVMGRLDSDYQKSGTAPTPAP